MIRVHGGEAWQADRRQGRRHRLPVVAGWQARSPYVATDPAPDDREKKVKEKDDARVVDEQFQRNRLYVIDVGHAGRPSGRDAGSPPATSASMSDTTPGFDWSPDGKSIVFAHVPTPSADDWTKSDLSVVDVGTGTVKPWSTRGRAETSPFFSPDGRWIAYVASDDPPTWAFDSCRVCRAGRGRRARASWPTRSTIAPSFWAGRRTDSGSSIARTGARRRGSIALPLDGEPQGSVPRTGGRRGFPEPDPHRGRVQLPDGGPAHRGYFVRLDRSESGEGQPRQRRTCPTCRWAAPRSSAGDPRTARRSRGS